MTEKFNSGEFSKEVEKNTKEKELKEFREELLSYFNTNKFSLENLNKLYEFIDSLNIPILHSEDTHDVMSGHWTRDTIEVADGKIKIKKQYSSPGDKGYGIPPTNQNESNEIPFTPFIELSYRKTSTNAGSRGMRGVKVFFSEADIASVQYGWDTFPNPNYSEDKEVEIEEDLNKIKIELFLDIVNKKVEKEKKLQTIESAKVNYDITDETEIIDGIECVKIIRKIDSTDKMYKSSNGLDNKNEKKGDIYWVSKNNYKIYVKQIGDKLETVVDLYGSPSFEGLIEKNKNVSS